MARSEAGAAAGEAIIHPGAWRGAELGDKNGVAFDLEPRHLRALEQALAGVRARGLAPPEIECADFPLDDIAADLEALRRRAFDGLGIVVVRGFPVDALEEADAATMFWGLGTHFGRAVSQSLMGDRLGHVTDVSRDNPNERGYRSRRELDMHTDSDDLVMMLCLRAARSGGKSRFTSALAVYNEILRTRPELLAPLFRGFRYHWRGEEAPGEAPVTEYRVPVFSRRDGLLSCVYLRAFIDMAADDLGAPLSREETDALDHFEAMTNRPDMVLELELRPGEAFLVNNYTVLHSRTAFEDDENPERRRHLLRLWLKAAPGRPVVDAVRRFYRDDGITERPGATTVYHPVSGPVSGL